MTVTVKGVVILNKAAVDQFGLKEKPHVVLAYERGSRLLLVYPQEKRHPSGIQMRFQSTGQATFGAKRYLLSVRAAALTKIVRQELTDEENISCQLQ